ncbi:MAG TPA: hypothetical protein ENJ88_11295, partial [Phaeodactylibacter sp.]|nr:hypothetical protein [Phaeodactylibacter sp.]
MFEEFSPVSKKEWLDKIEQDLKGRSPAELDWEPEPGLRVSPFAHPDDLPEPPPPMLKKQPGLQWLIGEDFDNYDSAEKLNEELLQALSFGLESPRLIFTSPRESSSIPPLPWLERALKNVELSFITPYFFFAGASEEELLDFIDFLDSLYGKSDPASPAGLRQHAGSISVGTRKAALSGSRLAKAREKLPAYRFIRQSIPGTAREGIVAPMQQALHDAWATFGESQLPLSDFNSLFYFQLETGPDYLLEIARLRALRLLWANALDQHGLNTEEEQAFLDIHLRFPTVSEQQENPTSETQQEIINKHMIAAAPMALAAIAGGADRLTIPPAGNQTNA